MVKEYLVSQFAQMCAKGLDQDKLGFWSECLKDEIDCVRLIGSTQKSNVFRLFGKKQNYIVKLTQDKESVVRDASVNRYLDSERILLNHRPSMIGHGEFLQKHYIVFLDDNLGYPAKGEYFTGKAMELLFHLHRHKIQLELPAICHSHTPDFQAISHVVRSLDVFALEQSMEDLNISYVARKEIMKLFGFLQFMDPSRLQTVKVLCHGDAHLGNFLWSWRKRNWFLIDWEFLHLNSPYFDLFQFIDATSPHEPLQYRMPRKAILMAYVKRNRELCQVQGTIQSWYQGYFVYSAYHLFWIVQRIWYDLEQGRFTSQQLIRQLAETYNLLAGIMRDWHRCKL